jgi:hypothetical protein
MKPVLTAAALLLSLVFLAPSSSQAATAPAARAPLTQDAASLPPGQEGARFMTWLHRRQPRLKNGCGDCWSIGWECCRSPWAPFGYYCVDPSAGEACGG